MDDFNREVLAVEAGLSFPAQGLVRLLKRLKEERGLPKKIHVDNGPEFIARHFKDFCTDKIHIHYIQPGKPTQNAYIERLNRGFRKEVLSAYWFECLEQVNVLAEQWRQDYNQYHPHSALGGLSQKAFLVQHIASSAEEAICWK